jgi:predicted nucleic acid-binding protein
MEEPMRLVLDTDVVVAAVRSDRGASRQVLVAALRGRASLVVTVALFLEYEAVLRRPEHLRASSLSRADIDGILDGLAGIVAPVEVIFHCRPQLNDPDDERVLEAAINGHADRLATFNARHFGPAKRFGIRVCAPRDMVGDWR